MLLILAVIPIALCTKKNVYDYYKNHTFFGGGGGGGGSPVCAEEFSDVFAVELLSFNLVCSSK